MLFTIAYEILGSATESDDVLQDSYLRWADVDLSTVHDTKSYLAQLVTRQALNALRAGARRREEYVGPWLPEPLLLDDQDPSTDVVLAESVSMAMLVLLETLSPDERAVFVLREVFGFDYAEIADAVGKPAPTVRQVAHRAREHVRARRKRFDTVDPQRNAEITAQFLATAASGDVEALMAMLAPDATWIADSGGKVSAARRPVVGAEKVARAIAGLMRRARSGAAGGNGDLQQRPGGVALPRRTARGRDHVRDRRRQDHQLLRDAQPGQAGRPGDRSRHQPRLATPALGCENPPFCQARAVRIDRLGDLGEAPRVLRAVGDATGRLGLPPPGRADRRLVRRAGGDRAESGGAAGGRGRRLRGPARLAGAGVRRGGRRLVRLPVVSGRRRRRAGTPDPRGRRRLDGLRAAPRPATGSGGTKAFPVRRCRTG